jgi:hypothetical protein
VDINTAGGFRHYLRVAAFSSQVLLHQAEVDLGPRSVLLGLLKIKTSWVARGILYDI